MENEKYKKIEHEWQRGGVFKVGGPLGPKGIYRDCQGMMGVLLSESRELPQYWRIKNGKNMEHKMETEIIW